MITTVKNYQNTLYLWRINWLIYVFIHSFPCGVGIRQGRYFCDDNNDCNISLCIQMRLHCEQWDHYISKQFQPVLFKEFYNILQSTWPQMNRTSQIVYLCSCCLRSLFSCSNLSSRKGSCRDASISFSVDHSSSFEGDADGCVLDSYPLGWTELGNAFLRLKVVITESSSNRPNVYRLYLPDVCFLRKKPEVANLF